MFKRLLVFCAIALGLFVPARAVFATRTPPTSPCLNPGSYIFALSSDDIFRLKMDAGQVSGVSRLHINVPGVSAGKITANSCHLVFGREKPDALSDLYHMNPSTGWEQNNITRSTEMAEMDPVLDPDGNRVAFTRYEPTGTNVMSEKLDGTMPRLEASEASSPAWQTNSPVSYTENNDSKIIPWGAYGYNHQYLPDRSGILVEGQDLMFFIWPVVGLPSDFGQFSSVAIRPSGNLAAVVTPEGVLEFLKLDGSYMPTGDVTPGPAISGITSLVWIEVK